MIYRYGKSNFVSLAHSRLVLQLDSTTNREMHVYRSVNVLASMKMINMRTWFNGNPSLILSHYINGRNLCLLVYSNKLFPKMRETCKNLVSYLFKIPFWCYIL